MKVFILEDELPAFEKINSYAAETIENYNLVGWARSTQEAAQKFPFDSSPDLILSDIELLDGISFKFFDQYEITTPVIFCTAFDQYLLRAFQTNGISYLLKPFDHETFAQAIHKFNTLFRQSPQANVINSDILNNIKDALNSNASKYKKRFSIKKKDGIKLLAVDNIAVIQAAGDFCKIYDHNNLIHTTSHSMGQIENLLDPTLFFRINRSEIININFIDKIDQHFKNRLQISLLQGKIKVFTSGSKTPEFRQWIDH